MEILISENNPAKAQLYVSLLQKEGIDVQITNQSMAGLIPVVDSGFILKVPTSQLAEAKTLLVEIQNRLNEKLDEDFYDADLNDIQYEKELVESEAAERKTNWLSGVIFIIFLLLVLFFLFFYSK